MRSETTVVIIGGGITGTGILWDLSLRGIKCTLIEKEDLGNGASGRNHGLLHSGGRYAVEDREAATECAQENMILKKIAPWAIDPCGGLFVRLAGDSPEYTQKWLKGCKDAGIKVEPQELATVYKKCPFLNSNIAEAYQVDDAAIEVYQIVRGLALASRSLGAEIKTRTAATGFVFDSSNSIVGVKTRNTLSGEEQIITASLVINATGSWAGIVARMANCRVEILPDRGVLLVFNSRLSNCVINRLREPGDGDILVPSHNISIFGTTSGSTSEPDRKIVARHEVEKLLTIGSELFPDLKSFRLLRAFAGVRPLLTTDNDGGQYDTRNLSRGFAIINHQRSDGVSGLVSVVGGKFTTFRLMAEKTADVAAAILGMSKPSATSGTPVPPPEESRKLWAVKAGAPAQRREGQQANSRRVCECEMVTAGEVLNAAGELEFFTLDDLRKRSRFGMGTCQGAFCAYRVLGTLNESGFIPPGKAVVMLIDFIHERWQGMMPALAQEQFRETEFAHALYTYIMGLDLALQRDQGRGFALA
ncbi:anaerobic glycerol-3-phosphate dehydrogenase subunit GlpA [Moorella sulfitireducens (nom. illeg.)]|uniref:anaerobic glycerol-3-phosphate dehydrogenase subunit GlpA n=1 Tax=Neomoorella sulfitireducens TaxID=2972948 RepID=UPI0021ABFCB9|nr:anaerobic glycerol-3-phosphate dehydrogenase subunit GlpA [Moorella sulfitireducens]